MTLRSIEQDVAARLQACGIHNAAQEAVWILQHVLALDRGALFLRASQTLSPRDRAVLQQLVRRRCAGEPLQYLLGSAHFFGLDISVGPGVLIPRPETECLVEAALERYPGQGRVGDICTGSGAVALALAAHLPEATVVIATDNSRRALDYAARNRAKNDAAHVHVILGDLFRPLRRGRLFSLITANPPYVDAKGSAELDADVRRHEPHQALFARESGISVIRQLISGARQRLVPGGWFLCEFSPEQSEAVVNMGRDEGYSTIDILKDHAGRDRILAAQVPAGAGAKDA